MVVRIFFVQLWRYISHNCAIFLPLVLALGMGISKFRHAPGFLLIRACGQCFFCFYQFFYITRNNNIYTVSTKPVTYVDSYYICTLSGPPPIFLYVAVVFCRIYFLTLYLHILFCRITFGLCISQIYDCQLPSCVFFCC